MRTTAAIFGALALVSVSGGAAFADMSLSKSLLTGVQSNLIRADFVQGHEMISGMPARDAAFRKQATMASSERYFDYDVMVTFGALTIAAGAFAAAAFSKSRRPVSNTAVRAADWREGVMRAVEAELTQYAVELRRAA